MVKEPGKNTLTPKKPWTPLGGLVPGNPPWSIDKEIWNQAWSFRLIILATEGATTGGLKAPGPAQVTESEGKPVLWPEAL